MILTVHHKSETGWFSLERQVVWSHHGIQSNGGLRSLRDQGLQDFQPLKQDREMRCSLNSLLSASTFNLIIDKLGLIIRSISKWIFLCSLLYCSFVTFVTWSLWSYTENNTIKSGMSSLQSYITLKPDCACTQNLLNSTKFGRESYNFGQHSQKILLLHSCCHHIKPNYYYFFLGSENVRILSWERTMCTFFP